MRKRVAMTVWLSALIAGWLFLTGPGVAAPAPKAYMGLFKDDAVAVIGHRCLASGLSAGQRWEGELAVHGHCADRAE